MSSADRNPCAASHGMVIVRVADEVNQALTGHVGCLYESPPQPRDQAMTLVEVLLGYARETLDASRQWSCPIAGGRRSVTLAPVERLRPAEGRADQDQLGLRGGGRA